MGFDEMIQTARDLATYPGFEICQGMAYFLMTEGGRLHGCGRIESIDPEWGPMDNGAPIDDGWILDLRDDKTFELCLSSMMKIQPTFVEV